LIYKVIKKLELKRLSYIANKWQAGSHLNHSNPHDFVLFLVITG
jgi:hypothetical protein